MLFRVDAGPGIGLGHLQRCLALCEALGRCGTDSVFLAPLADGIEQRIAAAGGRVVPFDLSGEALGGAADLALVIQHASNLRASVVIVDSYAVSAAYLEALREAKFKVVYIDDLAREPFPANIVINGGAQAASLGYRSSTGDTQFLLGPEFALLRSSSPVEPPAIGEVHQLLITVGGDDPLGVMPRLIDLVSAAPGNFAVVVVVGPFATTANAVDAAVSRASRPVRVVRASMGLRSLMLESDLAVSAGGQTLYELASVGIPTIAIEQVSNQHESLAALADAGVVKNAGHVGDPTFSDRFCALLHSLLGDAAERMRLRECGRRIVDGRGAERAAKVILALS